mgnify:CR=1 FL=1
MAINYSGFERKRFKLLIDGVKTNISLGFSAVCSADSELMISINDQNHIIQFTALNGKESFPIGTFTKLAIASQTHDQPIFLIDIINLCGISHAAGDTKPMAKRSGKNLNARIIVIAVNS